MPRKGIYKGAILFGTNEYKFKVEKNYVEEFTYCGEKWYMIYNDENSYRSDHEIRFDKINSTIIESRELYLIFSFEITDVYSWVETHREKLIVRYKKVLDSLTSAKIERKGT